MTEQTLNIPQLVIVALVGFFAIRWFFYSSSPSSSASSIRSQSSRNTVNPAHVDQVAQMFPQLSRREIAWDLQRNGGSVAATTERILSGRGLDTVSPLAECLKSQAMRRSGCLQSCHAKLMSTCAATAVFPTTTAGLLGSYYEIRRVHVSCAYQTGLSGPDNTVQPLV